MELCNDHDDSSSQWRIEQQQQQQPPVSTINSMLQQHQHVPPSTSINNIIRTRLFNVSTPALRSLNPAWFNPTTN
jgi:hypothetical protein